MNRWLYPIGRKLKGVNPNYITALAYPLVLLAAYFIATHEYLWGAVMLIISSVIDNIDGAVAKANNKKTLFGSYWDAFTDKMQESTLLLAFFLAGYHLESFIALWLSLMVAFAKARAEMVVPLGNIDWPAIGERAERLIIEFITLVVAAYWPFISGYDTISLGLWLLNLMALIGLLQRFGFARGLLVSKDKDGVSKSS